eukprot:m.264959 g.264959  ORF g.264959 m.264959 type:complete len:261 (-) comp54678_c0_seq6:195-977(-)
MAEETVTVAATPEVSIPFKFKLVAEGENMVTVLPCTCPACILANILREQATEEVEDEEIGDEDYEFEFELETQISENTGSRLDFADDFEDSLQSDPRTRRPARNQGGRSAKPKPKPHERIHHRDLKRKNEEQAARAKRTRSSVAMFAAQQRPASGWCGCYEGTCCLLRLVSTRPRIRFLSAYSSARSVPTNMQPSASWTSEPVAPKALDDEYRHHLSRGHSLPPRMVATEHCLSLAQKRASLWNRTGVLVFSSILCLLCL